MPAREYGLIIYGATGTTGRACCDYLSSRGSGIAYAIAGRNASALQQLAATYANPPDVIVADAFDAPALRGMAKQTRVVLSTAGPFATLGEGVLSACVAESTSYCDITGEIPWVSSMRRKFHADASAKKIRVVSCVGYDSIPSDIGVFAANRLLVDSGHGPAVRATSFHTTSGVLPRGTLNTIFASIVGRKTTTTKKKATEAISRGGASAAQSEGMVPKIEKKAMRASLGGLATALLPMWSSEAQCFTPVGFMATVNTPVVHASASALGYGGLLYRERMSVRGLRREAACFPSCYGLVSTVLSTLVYAVVAPLILTLSLMTKVPCLGTRVHSFASRALTQSPSTGKASAIGGRTTVVVYGVAANGATSRVAMRAKADPGVELTALLSCEAALLLADAEDLAPRYGFQTPASAFGDSIIAPLLAAGVKWEEKVERSKAR